MKLFITIITIFSFHNLATARAITVGLGRCNLVWAHEDLTNRYADRGFADIKIMKDAKVKIVRTDLRGLPQGAGDLHHCPDKYQAENIP